MEIRSMCEALQVQAQIIKSEENTRKKKKKKELTKIFTFSALSPWGDISHARMMVDSLESPTSFHVNTLLRAYAHGPDPVAAIQVFVGKEATPDYFTFPPLLKACSRLRAPHQGKQLHASALKSGFSSDSYVSHALIHMYGQCGDPASARKVFDGMPHRNVVSWTALIGALVHNGRAVQAVGVWTEMVGVEVNEAAVVSVLRACAEAGALTAGEEVLAAARERGIGLSNNVASAAIDMYAKCGCVERAREVFEEAGGCDNNRDVFAWTAVMSGLASHGKSREAIDLFDRMCRHGMSPDSTTMTAVLSACRNAGWLAQGYEYLRTMQTRFGVRPTVQHYSCVADLLARAGRLSQAEEFVARMPVQPDAALWRTLVWACKAHGDTVRAERLLKRSRLEGLNDPGSLVLAGNVYASAGKWRDKARARRAMAERGLAKPPGMSRVEIDGVVHEFVAGDSAHPEAREIYEKLAEVEERIRESGYRPRVSEVLLEIEDEEKASQLSRHSERLALAYGLAKTEPGSVIRIVKNLRSCRDCHDFIKAVSEAYAREIVIRDRVRFHYFSSGNCSCNDFW